MLLLLLLLLFLGIWSWKGVFGVGCGAPQVTESIDIRKSYIDIYEGCVSEGFQNSLWKRNV